MTQNPIRLVILDFDGTLADTSGLIIATMQATLQYMQLPVPTAEQVKRVIGLPLIDCFTHLVPMDDATAQKCSEAYRNIFEEKKNKEILPQPFPNVDATLRKLHADGYTLAVASSRLTYSLMSFIEAFQWTSLISEVIGPDKVEKSKPDPEPVNRILSDLHFKPQEALVVGDAPFDILMGKGAGAHTCAVTYGNASRESLAATQPDWIIDDFGKIIQILEQS